MLPEHATGQVPNLASDERLADTLFDMAGDQDVRVIEAIAAVLVRQAKQDSQKRHSGLSEASAPRRFAAKAFDTHPAGRHAICRRIARRALRGSLVDPTCGATAFHRIDDSPAWSRDLLPIGMFGPFLFYRPLPLRRQTSDGASGGAKDRAVADAVAAFLRSPLSV
jgi:hypothetical protein